MSLVPRLPRWLGPLSTPWTPLVATVVWAAVWGSSWEALSKPDTGGYLFLVEGVPLWSAEALGQIRTLGYPLFLGLVEGVTGSVSRVPWVQTPLMWLAILFYWRSCVRYGVGEWLALLAVWPLFFSLLVTYYGPHILPEAPAAAMGLLALGLVWRLAGPGGRWWHWVGLGAALFAGCQLRPALLFLPPLTVLLLPLLAAVAHGRAGEALPWRRLGRLTLLAALVAGGPLLLFSGVRWAVVDHFGLVSFGGTNAVGIAARLVDDPVVARLPADLRPVGEALLAERRRRGMGDALPAGVWERVREFGFLYNDAVHRVALPAARRQLGADPGVEGDPGTVVAVNGMLSRLAAITLRQQWREYLQWLWAAAVVTVVSVGLRFGEFLQGYGPGLAGVVGLALLARGRGPPMGGAWRRRGWDLLALALPAVGHLAAGGLLVILVEIPLARYVAHAALLMDGFLVALGFGVLLTLLELVRRRALP